MQRDTFWTLSNMKAVFKGNTPVNKFAKFSALKVGQGPEVL